MSCKACEEIPPVSVEYTEKGKFETIAGVKTCKFICFSFAPHQWFAYLFTEQKAMWPLGIDITGPADATQAIIFIYDVFGFASQTLQGADRLVQHLGSSGDAKKTLVFMPDLLKGEYVQPEWFTRSEDERMQLFAAFRAGPGNASKAAELLLAVRKDIADKFPAVDEHVAVGGLCWGGKISVLVCGEGNKGSGRKFNVAWTAHPG